MESPFATAPANAVATGSRKISDWLLVVVPWAVGGIGLAVAAGWLSYLPFTARVGDFQTTMKLMTAILFFISGFQLFVLHRVASSPHPSRFLRVGLWTLALFSFGAALVAIAANVSPQFAFSLGLIPDLHPHENFEWIPSISSPMTLACFLIISIASFFAISAHSMARKIFLAAGSVLVAVASIAIVGNVASVPSLHYQTSWAGGMAVHTAGLFFIIGLFFLALDMTKLVSAHMK
jgi:hypothetical protein